MELLLAVKTPVKTLQVHQSTAECSHLGEVLQVEYESHLFHQGPCEANVFNKYCVVPSCAQWNQLGDLEIVELLEKSLHKLA